MPQRKPIFTSNGFYHVYNRGHNKQKIFLEERDYKRYIKRLKEYLEKHPVSLIAYCLMPNHIHLLLQQNTEEPVERFIHRLHTAYTMYFNKKYERVGAVFQGRFKAKCIETDEHLLHVSRYIHLNPIELFQAQGPALRSKLLNFPWSSYREYLFNKINPSLCRVFSVLAYFDTTKKQEKVNKAMRTKYRSFVEEAIHQLSVTKLGEISKGDF